MGNSWEHHELMMMNVSKKPWVSAVGNSQVRISPCTNSICEYQSNKQQPPVACKMMQNPGPSCYKLPGQIVVHIYTLEVSWRFITGHFLSAFHRLDECAVPDKSFSLPPVLPVLPTGPARSPYAKNWSLSTGHSSCFQHSQDSRVGWIFVDFVLGLKSMPWSA